MRLDSKLKLADIFKTDSDFILEVTTVENESNPADWAIEVYELLPGQFENGFDSIDAVKYNENV